MSRLITAAAAVAMIATAVAANAEPVTHADVAIAAQGDAALSTMQADLVASLPLDVTLLPLNERPAETVELGYLIAAQGDAALEQVERQLPATIQADLALPELSVTSHFASATSLPRNPTEI